MKGEEIFDCSVFITSGSLNLTLGKHTHAADIFEQFDFPFECSSFLKASKTTSWYLPILNSFFIT